MENEITNLKENYLNICNAQNELRLKINRHTKQIERLEKRLSKSREKSFWGDLIVRPIIDMVRKKYPEIKWENDDRLVPLGLCNRISVFGDYKEETIMLCFVPNNLDEGVVSFETEERNAIYPENSIGYWNDMGKVAVDILDIKQIYEHIEKQMNEINDKT
jgi:hypothetical protein